MARVSELVRRLTRAGFVLRRHGGNHDIYEHPQTGRRVVVPRHGARELPDGTYRRIIRDAGLGD